METCGWDTYEKRPTLSHKTGKRVLATTATSALAFAGLIAMPIAAHAAAGDITLESLCGKTDRITVKNNTGVYRVLDQSNDVVYAIDADSGKSAATVAGLGAGTALDVVDATYSALTLPSAFWASAPATGKLNLDYSVLDAAGNTVVPTTAFNAINDDTCPASATIPVPSARNNVITVTKGEGLAWTVEPTEGTTATATAVKATYTKLDGTTVTLADGDDGTLEWAPGAPASATQTIRIEGAAADGDTVVVKAAPAPGYTGGSATYTFIPGAVQYAWVAPTPNDRDGWQSDTITVTNRTGIKYYYTTETMTLVEAVGVNKPDPSVTNAGSAGAVGSLPGTSDAADASAANTVWIPVSATSGATTTFNRPPVTSTIASTPVIVVAVADTGYAFSDTTTAKAVSLAFNDYTTVTALPAPEMVNGSGNADYYVLPQVKGVKWTVGPTSGGSSMTYLDNDPRLGTQIPVLTSGTAPVEYTFTATRMDATGGQGGTSYHWSPSITKKAWTYEFDSRATIAPEGPSWSDVTGLANDSMTLPSLAPGINYYQIATRASSTASVADGDYVTVDSGWYGRSVSLPDVQRYYSAIKGSGHAADEAVFVRAVVNENIFSIAKDADGNNVPTDWKYQFKNAIVVTPEPPIQDDRPGTANDTLTFPVTAMVSYRVTDANGATRTLAYTDLGKPLNYTGEVRVVPVAATGYQLPVNPDGSAFTGWTFTFDSSLGKITPQAPQSHDRAATDQDTYVVPNQPGVLWNVDGVDLDPSQYGKEIATGGKLEMRFVARAASGYSLADGAEDEFFLHWTDTSKPDGIGDPEISHTIRDNGYQADVEWSGPDDAEGVTYTVEFAKVTQDSDGDEVLGTLQTWKEDTEETGGRFSAGYGVTYKIYVTATDEHGTESETVSEYISFSEDPRGTESRWVDINRSTVTPSGNDALGWYQAGSSLYFNNTAFVTYRDQSNITFTVNGGQQLRVYGTQYTKGGRALIQVNGTNWAWLDAGASSNADPYKKMLRQINLPNTGTHTIKIIASLLPGKELALDAYEVVK